MAIRNKSILSVGSQWAWMQRLYPHFDSRCNRMMLTTVGQVQPTPLSDVYTFKLTYQAHQPPSIWVIDPKLVPREPGGRIPHMYDQDRLCLYLPGANEWSGDKILAEFIVPWISVWLEYYEAWHITGEWLGGGVEPEPKLPLRREGGGKNYERRN
jgi:hypothetical protein